MKKWMIPLLAAVLLLSGCRGNTASPPTADPTESTSPLPIQRTSLDALMQPIFSGNTVTEETAMFLEKGERKALLYPITEVQSITSYDGKTEYKYGKDYIVEDGQLMLTPNSSIPCITKEVYYGADASSLLQTEYNGAKVYTHWGEGRAMTDWQVCVTYSHDATWNGFTQKCELETMMPFVDKLLKHQDVTVLFYGDSITYGANASYISDYEPYQPSYPMLFVQALADLFGYKVQYVNTGLPDTPKVPDADYVAGENGTVTCVNTSMGGLSSRDGALHMDEYVGSIAQQYGCDLFVIGFGMNDGKFSPSRTAESIQLVTDLILEKQNDAAIVLISTMVPNPNAVNGWYGNQEMQGSALVKLARKYVKDGVACAVCSMTSVSLDILKVKEFHDYSGNNINHPNDFFARVYAQTLLQTVIGYENMD